MNKQEFLTKLKAHDWTYSYASGAAYYKGADNHSRLNSIADTNPELKALWEAYSAFVWEGAEEPTAEADTAISAATGSQSKQQYNNQMIMLDAWRIARKAAARFNDKAKTFFASALRQAWARAKAFALSSHSDATPITVFYICIDIKTSANTRLVNQPAVDTVYTSKEDALAALQILGSAFTRPFIKTSRYFNLAG